MRHVDVRAGVAKADDRAARRDDIDAAGAVAPCGERSDDVIVRMTQMALKTEGVSHAISVPGYSILTSTNIPNVGGMFVILEQFEERAGRPELSANKVADRLRKQFRDIQEAQAVANFLKNFFGDLLLLRRKLYGRDECRCVLNRHSGHFADASTIDPHAARLWS